MTDKRSPWAIGVPKNGHLTVPPGFGSVPAMSEIDAGEHPGTPRRKHRHDLGQEDHGPKLAAGTTRSIQMLLGLWIALTMVFVVYALVDGARPRDLAPPPPGSVAGPGAAPGTK
jgi:hypothetical protein